MKDSISSRTSAGMSLNVTEVKAEAPAGTREDGRKRDGEPRPEAVYVFPANISRKRFQRKETHGIDSKYATVHGLHEPSIYPRPSAE